VAEVYCMMCVEPDHVKVCGRPLAISVWCVPVPMHSMLYGHPKQQSFAPTEDRAAAHATHPARTLAILWASMCGC
jgi:hypothetical protein